MPSIPMTSVPSPTLIQKNLKDWLNQRISSSLVEYNDNLFINFLDFS